jgi:hypothetical protein
MTPEKELKQVTSDIELLEAEMYSNVEEIERINPLGDEYIKRERYLRLRNARLEEDLKELRTRKKSLIDHIEWERRTS